jgi:hypothetical protein
VRISKPATLRGVGLVLILAGLLLCYNLLVDPSWRLGGDRLDSLILLGPVALAMGVLIAREGRTRGAPAEHERMSAGGALKLGVGLLAVPAGFLVVASISGSLRELTGFLFTASAFIFGLPGVLFIMLGLVRLWRPCRVR